MIMITVAPFTIEHFDRMDINNGAYPRREDRYLFEAYATHGPAVTVFDEDLIIASGGIAVAWSGLGEAWLLPSVYVRKYPKAVFSISAGFIANVIKKYSLRRVQATIRAEDVVSIRWINALKFKREGLLSKFGPGGEDHYMYARIE
jgi:hypothetical protein